MKIISSLISRLEDFWTTMQEAIQWQECFQDSCIVVYNLAVIYKGNIQSGFLQTKKMIKSKKMMFVESDYINFHVATYNFGRGKQSEW